MILVEQLQSVFPNAIDYLIKDNGVTIIAIMAELPENTETRIVTVNDLSYNITPILLSGMGNYCPVTSLVNGQKYVSAKTEESTGKTYTYVSAAQVASLNKWMGYHLVAFDIAAQMLLSREVATARAMFNNPLNGLVQLVAAINADLESENPQATLDDPIPGAVNGMTFGEFLLRLQMWSGLENFLNTPMGTTGVTPMQLMAR